MAYHKKGSIKLCSKGLTCCLLLSCLLIPNLKMNLGLPKDFKAGLLHFYWTSTFCIKGTKAKWEGRCWSLSEPAAEVVTASNGCLYKNSKPSRQQDGTGV